MFFFVIRYLGLFVVSCSVMCQCLFICYTQYRGIFIVYCSVKFQRAVFNQNCFYYHLLLSYFIQINLNPACNRCTSSLLSVIRIPHRKRLFALFEMNSILRGSSYEWHHVNAHNPYTHCTIL